MASNQEIIHYATTNPGAAVALGTSLNAAKKMEMHFNTFHNSSLHGKIGSIVCRLDTLASLSGSPKLTVRICSDSNGDNFVYQQELDIRTGLTTSSKGGASVKVDLAFEQDDTSTSNLDKLWIFACLDQGSGNWNFTQMSMIE